MDTDTTSPVAEVTEETSAEVSDINNEGNGEETIEVQPKVTPQSQPTSADPLEVLEKLEGLDANLKEQLKSGFMRQQDYTRKTQEVAEMRKEYQAWKQQQAQPKNPEVPQEEQIPEDPKEYAEWVKQSMREELRQEMARERDFQAAEGVDPRLNSDQEFASIIAGYVAQDQTYLQGQKSAVQATHDAIARYKSYEDTIRSRVVGEMNEKAKAKRMVAPEKNGSPFSAGTKKVASTMQEAAQMAEDEIGTL